MARHDLIKRVRQARIVQAFLVYLGASWVVLQIADVMQEAVGLPQWAMGLVLLLLIIGLVIILATAWVQAQPNTDAREKAGEVPTDWEIAPWEALASLAAGRIPHPTWGRAVAGGVVAIGLWAVVATVLLLQPDPTLEATAAEELQSIAVLPFSDLSPSGDQKYFSDGLSEELLNLLAKNPALRVAGRSSSFTYRGETVGDAQIGQELNVSHLLGGSVRKDGDQLRITVRLTQVSTESQIWSESFDRSLDDVFKVQEEIAESVVQALKVEFLGEAPGVPETDPEAYRLVLEGRYLLLHYDGGDGVEIEQAYLKALRIDPDYAPAWAGLALLYDLQVNYRVVDLENGLVKARQAVDRALTLDPELAETWLVLADIRRGYDWDFLGADEAMQRALDLEPGNSRVLGSAAGLALGLGKFGDALDLVDRAVALDPLDPSARVSQSATLLYSGRIAEAEVPLREALALDPQLPGVNALLCYVLVLLERPQEALDQLEEEVIEPARVHGKALALYALGGRQEAAGEALQDFASEFGHAGAFQVAQLHAFRGEVDQAFEWLDRAYEQRDAGLTQLIGDPLLSNLVTDPRWRALLERVGLPTGTPGSGR